MSYTPYTYARNAILSQSELLLMLDRVARFVAPGHNEVWHQQLNAKGVAERDRYAIGRAVNGAARNALVTIATHATLLEATELLAPLVNVLLQGAWTIDFGEDHGEAWELTQALAGLCRVCKPTPMALLRDLAQHPQSCIRNAFIKAIAPDRPEQAKLLRDMMEREPLLHFHTMARTKLGKIGADPPWWVDRTGVDPRVYMDDAQSEALRLALEPLFEAKHPFTDDASRQALLALVNDLPDPVAVGTLGLVLRDPNRASVAIVDHLHRRDGGVQMLIGLTELWSQRYVPDKIFAFEPTEPDLAQAARSAIAELLRNHPHEEPSDASRVGHHLRLLILLLHWPQDHPPTEQAHALLDLIALALLWYQPLASLTRKLKTLPVEALPWERLAALDMDASPDLWWSCWSSLMQRAPTAVLEPLLAKLRTPGTPQRAQSWELQWRIMGEGKEPNREVLAKALADTPDTAFQCSALHTHCLDALLAFWATHADTLAPESVLRLLGTLTRQHTFQLVWSEYHLLSVAYSSTNARSKPTAPLTEADWTRWRTLRKAGHHEGQPKHWQLALNLLPSDVEDWTDDDHAWVAQVLERMRQDEPLLHQHEACAGRQLMLTLISRDGSPHAPDVVEVYERLLAVNPTLQADLDADRTIIERYEELLENRPAILDLRLKRHAYDPTYIAAMRPDSVEPPWVTVDILRDQLARLREHMATPLVEETDSTDLLGLSLFDEEEDKAFLAEKTTTLHLLIQIGAFGHLELLADIAPLLLKVESAMDNILGYTAYNVLPPLLYHAARLPSPPVEAFKLLLRSRNQGMRSEVVKHLNCDDPDQIALLERAFTKDDSTDVRRLARQRLDTIKPLPWWSGIFSNDPAQSLDETQMVELKETFEELRALFASRTSLYRSLDALLPLIETLPTTLRQDLLTSLLRDTSTIGRSTELLEALLATEHCNRSLYRLVRTWALRDIEGWLHVDHILAPGLVARRNEPSIQALAERLLTETLKSYNTHARLQMDRWPRTFLQLSGRLWATDVSPAPLLEILGILDEGRYIVQGDLLGAFDRCQPDAALLEQVQAIRHNGYPGSWTPQRWRELLKHISPTLEQTVAAELLFDPDLETQRWAAEILILGGETPDGERFQHLLDMPETREALLTSTRLMGVDALFPFYRSHLLGDSCTRKVAHDIMCKIRLRRPDMFVPYALHMTIYANPHKRALAHTILEQQQPGVASESTAPTPEEWEAWRRLRTPDDIDLLPRARKDWTDSDNALVQSALDRWRDHGAFTGHPGLLQLALALVYRDRADTDRTLLDALFERATTTTRISIVNLQAIHTTLLEMIGVVNPSDSPFEDLTQP
ncbi:MAG: hypothetical protein AAFX99_00110 [Myxococcota bacterium]